MKNKFKEKAEQLGKTLLIENSILHVKPENIIEFKEKQIVESSKDNGKYEALAILKEVEVSKYTENKNKRKYPKEEWVKVIENKEGEGTYCLAGHPEGEGNPEKAWGIWHNLRALDEKVVADLYLIEEKPVRILKAGGPLGTSSVGYGNLKEDGEVYDFELDRVADIVLDPSQGTLATRDNLNENKEKEDVKKEESVKSIDEGNTNKINEEITTSINNQNTNNKGKEEEVNDMDIKILEATLKNNVNAIINDAKKNENLMEAIQSLKELEVPENLSSVKEKIDSTINTFQTKLDEQKKAAEEELKNKASKVEELEKELNECKEKYEKAKGLLEKTGVSEEDDVKNLKETNKKLEEDLKSLKEDTEARDKDINQFVEDREKMEEDIELFKSYLEKAEKRIVAYEEEMEKLGYKFEEEKDDEDEDEKKDKDKKDKENDEDEDEMKEKKKESTEYKVKFKEKYNTKKKTEQDDMEDEEDEDEDEMNEKKKKKESNENTEIQRIFENQVKKFPGLETIKEEVLKSETTMDAMRKIVKFKEQSEDIVTVSSVSPKLSGRKPSWLGNRR